MLKGARVQPGWRVPASSISQMVGVCVEQLRERGYRLLSHLPPRERRCATAHRARKGGASIGQVQLMLGHASPKATSAYIGETLDLDDHAVDYADVLIP